MKYYTDIKEILVSDLQLLKDDPEKARASWSLKINLPKLKGIDAIFVPLWIEGDDIIFLSEKILTVKRFNNNNKINSYNDSEIRKHIENTFGENFFLLSREDIDKLPTEMLKAELITEYSGWRYAPGWWINLPSYGGDPGVVDYMSYDAIVVKGEGSFDRGYSDSTKKSMVFPAMHCCGVRPAVKFKIAL